MTAGINQLSYKLVLLGESAVGKSSIVLRFVRQDFLEHQEATIGAAFLTQVVNLGDQQSIKFEIWDTAGQERYKTLAPMYYRGAAAAVIVYDITNMDSFNRAKVWVQQLQNQQGDSSVVIALAGNKSDLSESRVVETAEAQAYADEKGLIFFECSAKANNNINDIFISIAKKLPTTRPDKKQPGDATTVPLDGQRQRKSEKCGC